MAQRRKILSTDVRIVNRHHLVVHKEWVTLPQVADRDGGRTEVIKAWSCDCGDYALPRADTPEFSFFTLPTVLAGYAEHIRKAR